MKQKRRLRKIFLHWLLMPVLSVVTFITTNVATNHKEWIELNYSQKIYPSIAKVLSKFNSIVSFSIDDLFYLALIFLPIILILLLILKRISFKLAGKIALNTVASVYILFYILWGFNYFRSGLNERLGLRESDPNKESLLAVLEKLIVQTNQLQCSFDSFKYTQADEEIERAYEKLAPLLKIQYPMGKRDDKKITFSKFYSKTRITGYFGPFFNEVHVNKKVLPIEYPYVLAHEKAHQFGITSEAEANFFAWIVCTNSESQQIRYSGNLFVLYHFLIQAYELDEYKELVKQISPEVRNDFERIRQHWRKLRNEKISKTASKVNDVYLKTNKVEEGIKDYRGVVKHVMNFSLDSTFQKRLISTVK